MHSLTRLIYALLIVTAAGVTAAADQNLEREVQFDIPSQPLSQSVIAFSEQSGIQIVTAGEDLPRSQTPEVRGKLAISNALRKLLSGTHLRFKSVGEGTVALIDEGSPSQSSANLPGREEPIRLAQSAASSGVEKNASESQAVTLEEIVVTAQKREERAIDVPISITALSAEELKRRNVTDLSDLSFAVPGLAVETGGTNTRVLLRGISNVTGGLSLIGMYLDESSATSAGYSQLDLRTYDLERIEVLRGPQGTLYGEGSVGGTIRFITRDPQLDHFGVNADASTLFIEDGDSAEHVGAMLNMPLVENVLGVRIAGEYLHGGGWIDQPAAGRKDFNGQDLMNVRVKGLWRPLPQLAVNAMAVIHRNDESQNAGEDSDGDFTQALNLLTKPRVKNDYELYNLTFTYDFPGARLLATSTSIDQDIDTTNWTGRLQLLPPPGTRSETYSALDKRPADIRTHELRLTSTGTTPWQWTLGGYYRHFRYGEDAPENYFAFFPLPPGDPLPAPYAFQLSKVSNSWALFGDSNYRLSERLTLGAGLRYFEDKQEDRIAVLEGKFHTVNPRAYAQFKVTDSVNVYGSAAKGFRSGGFNLPGQPAYDPEKVWTYELGTKMSLADRSVSLELAAFYSDYSDYQIFGQAGTPPLAVFSNAGNARIKGVDWGFLWRTGAWTMSFNGSYVHSEFYKIDAASTSHLVGDPLDLFPKYSLTTSVQRDFSWSGRPGFARLDYSQRGRETYRNRGIGPWYYNKSDVINILNGNLGLQWSKRLSLNLFAQNLLNDRGFTAPLSIEDGSSRARPRAIGVGFDVSFE